MENLAFFHGKRQANRRTPCCEARIKSLTFSHKRGAFITEEKGQLP